MGCRAVHVACLMVALLVSVTPAFALNLEVGGGMTIFPLRGADVGPFVSVNVWEIPKNIPVLGGEAVFADFGVINGVASFGPAVSIKAGEKDTRMRFGWSAWRDAHLDCTFYVRYGAPFTW